MKKILVLLLMLTLLTGCQQAYVKIKCKDVEDKEKHKAPPRGKGPPWTRGRKKGRPEDDDYDEEQKGNIKITPLKKVYKPGDKIRVTAKPKEGYEFSGWVGSLPGKKNPRLVVVEEDLIVGVKFKAKDNN